MVIRSAARIDDILKSDQARIDREAAAPTEVPEAQAAPAPSEG
jgi:hypothetical protein